MPVYRIIYLFLLSVILLACQKPKPATVLPETLDIITYKTVKPSDNRIYVPVVLNNKDYVFLLDTGASTNVVDLSVSLPQKDYLGKQSVGSVFDPVLSDYYSLDQLKIGNTDLLPDITYVLNLGGVSYQGILGVASLNSKIIYIIPQDNQLHILNSIPAQIIKEAHQFALTSDEAGRPAITINLTPGFQETFVLDTGAQTSSLVLERFDELRKKTGSRTVDALFSGASGTYKTKAMWLNSLSFAGVQHEDVMLSKSAESLLGMDVLSKYNVIIDFKYNRLYLINI